MNEAFRKFAHRASEWLGSPWAFSGAFFVIVAWAGLGLIFGFSDGWQLLINTGTTIVTFLMVFLIQNTQNRDNRALHAKIDELIIKTEAADNKLVDSEDMSDEELRALEQHYHEMAHTVRKRLTGEDPDSDGHAHPDDPPADESEDGDHDTPSRSYRRLK
jgi:low affinity Fe/Cu permease